MKLQIDGKYDFNVLLKYKKQVGGHLVTCFSGKSGNVDVSVKFFRAVTGKHD